MNLCTWCNFSENEKRWLLTENLSWYVFLADKQDYVGHCILVLKRHCGCLSNLTDNEWIELKHLIVQLENCFKVTLNAELFNWSCLLNDFYKSSEPNPHLHLHVRPRYKQSVSLNGKLYYDEEFGHHYDNHKGNQISDQDRNILYKKLKQGLGNLD